MAITVPQVANIPDAYSGAFGSAVGGGDSILMAAYSFNTTAAAITGTSPLYNGSTPAGTVQLVAPQSALLGGVSVWAALWLMPNVTGGGTTIGVTVTNGTLNTAVGLLAWDVAGLGATPAADVNVSNPQTATGNSATPATANVTTSGAPDILIGGNVIADGGQAAGSAGFTSQGMGGASFGGYLIEPTAGAVAAWSVTGTLSAWAAFLVAITATAAPPPVTSYLVIPNAYRFLPFTGSWPQTGAEAGGRLRWFPV